MFFCANRLEFAEVEIILCLYYWADTKINNIKNILQHISKIIIIVTSF